MLTDKEKKSISNIVTQHRPDLQKELLNKNSFIYDRIENYLSANAIDKLNTENLERAWINTNLEDPIPDLTNEIDVLIEEKFSSLKKELTGLSIYTNVLIDIAERNDILDIYERHNYFSPNFVYSQQFTEDLFAGVSKYLEQEEYI